MQLETVIGLEIHVQLKTRTKMFCGCAIAEESANPNTSVCPICLGHPGTLPVANNEAIRLACILSLALGATIRKTSRFARKHYFYPDLPKGYQITQYDEPLAEDGYYVLKHARKQHRIRIERLHVEEDSAKLVHVAGRNQSLLDFNRAGTALVEIVTRPDFGSPVHARMFLESLRSVVRALGISDGDMERGHLRCDANISLRPAPHSQQEAISLLGKEAEGRLFWPKTEIKNINSFRSVEHALQYEIERQTALWKQGNPPMQQSTRGWNDQEGITIEQRIKEQQEDYRYLLEPDLPPLVIDEVILSELAAKIPELPNEIFERFEMQYGLSEEILGVLLRNQEAAHFFEGVASDLEQWMKETHHERSTFDAHLAKLRTMAATWIVTKLYECMHEANIAFATCKMSEENFSELLLMVHKGVINSSTAVAILKEMVVTGEDPSNLVAKKGATQIDDEEELVAIIQAVIDAHPAIVLEYKSGKTSVLQYLLGQTMKKSKGRANPKTAKKMLETFLR